MKNRIRRNLNEASAFLNEYTPPLVYPDFLNNNFSQLMLDEREMTMKLKGESNLEGETYKPLSILAREIPKSLERKMLENGRQNHQHALPPELKEYTLVRKA